MVLCDAPGAALIGIESSLFVVISNLGNIGINKGEEYLKCENLFEDYPSCIFICLDEQKIYMDVSNKPELPYFDNLEKNLLSHYVKLNTNLNYQMVETNISAKPKLARKESMKLTGNGEHKDKCLKILEIFRNTINDKIIKYIPEKPIYLKDKVNLYVS